jgi:hypothetical protein
MQLSGEHPDADGSKMRIIKIVSGVGGRANSLVEGRVKLPT